MKGRRFASASPRRRSGQCTTLGSYRLTAGRLTCHSIAEPLRAGSARFLRPRRATRSRGNPQGRLCRCGDDGRRRHTCQHLVQCDRSTNSDSGSPRFCRRSVSTRASKDRFRTQAWRAVDGQFQTFEPASPLPSFCRLDRRIRSLVNPAQLNHSASQLKCQSKPITGTQDGSPRGRLSEQKT